MVHISEVVALVLGLYEFISVAKILLVDAVPSDVTLFPVMCYKIPALKALLVAFTTFLGLLRLQWVVSGRTVLSWVCIIATHIVEATMFWTMAIQPHFNTKGLSFVDLVVDVLKFNYGTMDSVILLLVPSLVMLFTLSGPLLPAVAKRDTKRK